MKKIFISLLITGLISGSQIYAQHGQGKGQGQEKNNQKKGQADKPKPVDKTKPNQGQMLEKPKPGQGQPQHKPGDQHGKYKENQGKGHAYGKNKDSLQGRDFGQNRAAEARSKHEAITNSESRIDATSKTNEVTRSKIKAAKDKLELKRKNKQISQSEYLKKKKDLDDLEMKVNELDKKNKDVKDKVDKEKQVK